MQTAAPLGDVSDRCCEVQPAEMMSYSVCPQEWFDIAHECEYDIRFQAA